MRACSSNSNSMLKLFSPVFTLVCFQCLTLWSLQLRSWCLTARQWAASIPSWRTTCRRGALGTCRIRRSAANVYACGYVSTCVCVRIYEYLRSYPTCRQMSSMQCCARVLKHNLWSFTWCCMRGYAQRLIQWINHSQKLTGFKSMTSYNSSIFSVGSASRSMASSTSFFRLERGTAPCNRAHICTMNTVPMFARPASGEPSENMRERIMKVS